MRLQTSMFSYANRRNIKSLASSVIGLAGLVIASFAIMLSQDYTVMLTQISQGFSLSPLGVALGSLAALVF